MTIHVALNFMTVGILLYLISHYYALYRERRERIYKYFAHLMVSITLFMLITTEMYATFFRIPLLYMQYVPMLNVVTVFFCQYFVVKFILLLASVRYNRVYSWCFFALLILIAFVWIVNLNLGIEVYMNHIKQYTMAFSSLIQAITGITIFLSIVKKRENKSGRRKVRDMYTLLGTVFIILYIMLISLSFLINELLFLRTNFFAMAVIMQFFSLALAKQFSREHAESIKLKNSFKRQVDERTLELKEANDTLRANAEKRKSFFENLAHELKTPLNLIVNYLPKIKLKLSGPDDDFAIISGEFRKLYHKFKNLLMLEVLERGDFQYNHSQNLNITAFTEKKVELAGATADHKGISIKLEKGKEPLFGAVDAGAFDSILTNLLSNALKYSKPGGTINIRLASKEDRTVLSVCNESSQEIPEHFKEKVTRPFAQNERNAGGVGLGLAIVNNIVCKINGAAFEINTPGKNAVEMKVFFPAASPAVSEKEPRYSMESAGSIDDFIEEEQVDLLPEPVYRDELKTLFIVEDNRKTVNMMVSFFRENFNVFYSLNGEEALEKITRIPLPDIILSDVMMPLMDGISFCREVKKEASFGPVPFIFLTAKADDFARIEGLEAGALDYIEKMTRLPEIQYKINNWLDYTKLRDQLIRAEVMGQFQKKKISQFYKEYNITDRELEIVSVVTEYPEKSYSEIAKMFGVTKTTVSNHVYNVAGKIDSITHREVFSENFIKLEKAGLAPDSL